MERHVFAYLLIAVMIAAAIGWGFYLRYHSREPTLRRRRSREKTICEAKAEAASR